MQIKNDMVFAVVLQEQERPIPAMAIKALKEKTGKTYYTYKACC
jgi:hypothetical protein